MRRLLAALRRRPAVTAIGALALTIALAGAAFAATEYTSRPKFCTSCHEMDPYYAAWDAGAHAGVSCVSCHVDPGLEAQVSHKFVALKEVYDHFTTDPKFPGAVTDIPDSRCLACHSGTIDPKIAGFSHESHRGSRTCVDCHGSVGHTVTSAALAEAGILDPAAAQARELLTAATVGSGSTDLAGHVKVSCSSCHDLATTACATCHTTEARSHPTLNSVTAETADCTTCHTAGTTWKFSHPTSKTCTSCHKAPANHYGTTCANCHTPSKAWSSASFSHPRITGGEHTYRSFACTNCHPNGYGSATCTKCHDGTPDD